MVERRVKVQGNRREVSKRLALRKKGEAMYRVKDREQNYLFKELLPFGGKLEENNRWVKIKKLIPSKCVRHFYFNNFSGNTM